MTELADSPDPVVTILMGSKSDWPTMSAAARVLDDLGIPFEARAISAHRASEFLFEYLDDAVSRGIRIIIAGAGGAAHLPGVVASRTSLPVLGVPIKTQALGGLDSLLSIVQMPAGVPVATFAIGEAGASNAAHFAARVLAISNDRVRTAVDEFRANLTERARTNPDPRT